MGEVKKSFLFYNRNYFYNAHRTNVYSILRALKIFTFLQIQHWKNCIISVYDVGHLPPKIFLCNKQLFFVYSEKVGTYCALHQCTKGGESDSSSFSIYSFISSTSSTKVTTRRATEMTTSKDTSKLTNKLYKSESFVSQH